MYIIICVHDKVKYLIIIYVLASVRLRVYPI